MADPSPSASHASALLRRGAERDRNKVAILWEDGARTYGDRVGVLFPNGPHFLEAWWAIVQLGAVVVPLSTRAVPRDLTCVLNDAGAAAILADAEYLPLLMDVRREVPSLRLIVGRAADPVPEVVSFEALAEGPAVPPPSIALSLADPCAIYYTAGTTGVSKGTVRSHLSVTWGLALVAATIPGDEVYLARAPMYHTGGSLTGPFATLAAGATLVSMRGFDARTLLGAVERHRITRAYVHPTLVENALLEEMDRHAYDLGSLRFVQWTAGPLPEAVRAHPRALSRPPLRGHLRHDRGQQHRELPVHRRPPQVRLLRRRRPGRHRHSHRGRGRRAHPIRPRGRGRGSLAHGDDGLLARSPTHGSRPRRRLGAHRRPRLPRCRGLPTPRRPPEGRHRHWRGDRPRHRGENALASLPAVVETAVVGLPDPTWGEAVTAVVVARPDAGLTEAAVIAHCHQELAGHKCPKRVLFVDTLPKNAVGKVQKLELVRRFGEPDAL